MALVLEKNNSNNFLVVLYTGEAIMARAKGNYIDITCLAIIFPGIFSEIRLSYRQCHRADNQNHYDECR